MQKIPEATCMVKMKPAFIFAVTAENCHMDARYAQVPEEFRHLINSEATRETKSRKRRVKYNGEYFVRGCSPPEIFKRWNRCEDLAFKHALKANRSKEGKCSHMSEEELLGEVLNLLSKGRHGSPDELKWLIRRMAGILKWPVPRTAK